MLDIGERNESRLLPQSEQPRVKLQRVADVDIVVARAVNNDDLDVSRNEVRDAARTTYVEFVLFREALSGSERIRDKPVARTLLQIESYPSANC